MKNYPETAHPYMANSPAAVKEEMMKEVGIEDIEELAHLRQKTRVPLATGERLFTKYGFAPICARHLVDYVQPDVVHTVKIEVARERPLQHTGEAKAKRVGHVGIAIRHATA